nr:diguanylate cyclase [uncultured Massilia sp.]
MPDSANHITDRLERLDRLRRPILVRSIVLLAGFCALLIGLHGWSLWASRQHQLKETGISTENMARALASHAERSIKVGGAILAEIVERGEHDSLDGASGERIHARMQTMVAHTPELQEVFIYGPDGARLASSLPRLVKGNNSDRPYFQYHKTHTDRGVLVGKPIYSRSSGVLAIPLSRRIDRPDGSFGGVAMASLKLQFFGKFYNSFDVGPSGTILLMLDDGTLLYRRPFKEAMVGTSVANGPVYQLYQKHGPVGTAMLVSNIDGIERLYSYRHLDGFPMIVATAQAKSEILAGWWVAVIKMSCVVLFAVAVLAWGGKRMIGQLRVREALEDELRRARTSLEVHNISLRVLADSDGLTGLANRRRFEETLASEHERARRSRRPFSLILTDVDFFKKFNDRYGHVAGDECLRLVAKAIASGPHRPADLAARYGGEEFAVILPDTDLDGARAVAEKIRMAVEALEIPHADSPTGIVTLSLGVYTGYTAIDGSDVPCDWTAAADGMLYQAKAGGRNRVAARTKVAAAA